MIARSPVREKITQVDLNFFFVLCLVALIELVTTIYKRRWKPLVGGLQKVRTSSLNPAGGA